MPQNFDSPCFNYIRRNGLFLFYFQIMLCGSLVDLGFKEIRKTKQTLLNSTLNRCRPTTRNND